MLVKNNRSKNPRKVIKITKRKSDSEEKRIDSTTGGCCPCVVALLDPNWHDVPLCSVMVQVHVALAGNPAAASSGQPLKCSHGCKSGLVAVDVFNIFLPIDKVYGSGVDLTKKLCRVVLNSRSGRPWKSVCKAEKHCCYLVRAGNEGFVEKARISNSNGSF